MEQNIAKLVCNILNINIIDKSNDIMNEYYEEEFPSSAELASDDINIADDINIEIFFCHSYMHERTFCLNNHQSSFPSIRQQNNQSLSNLDINNFKMLSYNKKNMAEKVCHYLKLEIMHKKTKFKKHR